MNQITEHYMLGDPVWNKVFDRNIELTDNKILHKFSKYIIHKISNRIFCQVREQILIQIKNKIMNQIKKYQNVR